VSVVEGGSQALSTSNHVAPFSAPDIASLSGAAVATTNTLSTSAGKGMGRMGGATTTITFCGRKACHQTHSLIVLFVKARVTSRWKALAHDHTPLFTATLAVLIGRTNLRE
jgi:hypothetical protein